ncbi:DUF3558 domain-containing protein [Nocardia brasiliensis]|uniref:DUF3558 domain-containing protein n=1 Tax=Nocardia brasiliensis TaxID=37326 RepID=A0A6G9XZ00_NOCBR|nr:DUF3558 domain-containing protein [Nocardia brasiliensis]QIS06080.1 DUF3558 domain-containing protein [Nocardia brasiliensis]
MSFGRYRKSTPRIGFAATAAGLLLVTGCVGEKAGGTTTTDAPSTPSAAATTTAATNPHTAFDPCSALTPQILAAHQWDAKPPEPKQDSAAGVTWQGCRYVAKAGYGFVVETTTGTLAEVREKFPAASEIATGPRKALRYEARPDIPGGCSINVEMRSGSLYILTNVPQTPANKHLGACEITTEIAQAVAPLLPEGS